MLLALVHALAQDRLVLIAAGAGSRWRMRPAVCPLLGPHILSGLSQAPTLALAPRPPRTSLLLLPACCAATGEAQAVQYLPPVAQQRWRLWQAPAAAAAAAALDTRDAVCCRDAEPIIGLRRQQGLLRAKGVQR